MIFLNRPHGVSIADCPGEQQEEGGSLTGQQGSGTQLPETFYRDHRCEMPAKDKDQGPVPPWAARETINNHCSLPFGSAL